MAGSWRWAWWCGERGSGAGSRPDSLAAWPLAVGACPESALLRMLEMEKEVKAAADDAGHVFSSRGLAGRLSPACCTSARDSISHRRVKSLFAVGGRWDTLVGTGAIEPLIASSTDTACVIHAACARERQRETIEGEKASKQPAHPPPLRRPPSNTTGEFQQPVIFAKLFTSLILLFNNIFYLFALSICSYILI